MSTISLALDILLNGALLVWARLTPPLPGVLRFVRPLTCTVIRELTTQLPLLCRIAAFLMAAPFALCIALDIVAYGKSLPFRLRAFQLIPSSAIARTLHLSMSQQRVPRSPLHHPSALLSSRAGFLSDDDSDVDIGDADSSDMSPSIRGLPTPSDTDDESAPETGDVGPRATLLMRRSRPRGGTRQRILADETSHASGTGALELSFITPSTEPPPSLQSSGSSTSVMTEHSFASSTSADPVTTFDTHFPPGEGTRFRSHRQAFAAHAVAKDGSEAQHDAKPDLRSPTAAYPSPEPSPLSVTRQLL